MENKKISKSQIKPKEIIDDFDDIIIDLDNLKCK